MPQSFWLATLPVKLEALRAHAEQFDIALREAIRGGFANALCIELIRDDALPRRLALLVSVADSSNPPKQLTCWMGFSNAPDWCDRFRRQGVPMIEARLVLTRNGSLRVRAACSLMITSRV